MNTAQYIKYIKTSYEKFLELSNITPVVNSTLTAYSILDLSQFADFLIELYNKNNHYY